MTKPSEPLLAVRDLHKHFPLRTGLRNRGAKTHKAVNGVSFETHTARSLGLVGESGSGKTTVGRLLLRLIPATSGEVLYQGRDVFKFSRTEMKHFRREVQIVFQDPAGSLNPSMTVGSIVSEPLVIHRIGNRKQRRDQVAHLLTKIGLDTDCLRRYPHEFSGGQRQRICIARALILQPKLIILDEPTSALDVTIQSQILRLLTDLRLELGLSYLFISHNLAVVRHFCDEVAVMRAGKIVEQGSTRRVFSKPQHDYTKTLLSAVPRLDSYRTRKTA